MRKTIHILLVFVSIGTIAYVLAPLFLVQKNRILQVGNNEDASSAKNSVVEVIKEATHAVESALHLNASCYEPFRYAIGNVDPRFNISEDTLKEDLLKAEVVWEDGAKEDVLQYDPTAQFKVNLVFDERQQETIESKKLEKRLDAVQAMQQGISKEYDALSSQYNKKKAQYESDVKKYKNLADDYEKQVAYWNGKGGAPEDEYQKLQQQRNDVNALADTVEKERKSLNVTVAQLNELVKKEKNVIASYNKEVTTYESAYGGEKEFDQGVYTGSEINIYQFGEESELVLVLAHELGHALGVDHVENPTSIMYYLMAEQDINHIVPSAEDLEALKNRCL